MPVVITTNRFKTTFHFQFLTFPPPFFLLSTCRSCSTFVIEHDKHKLIPLQNLTLVAKNIFFEYYVKSINQREMNSGKKIKARKIFKPRS